MRKAFFLMIVLLLLSSCSNDNTNQTENVEITDYEMQAELYSVGEETSNDVPEDIQVAQKESNEPEEAKQTGNDRKLIYEAFLNIEVKNLNQTIHHIEQKVSENNGYIIESNKYGASNEETGPSAHLVVRVPQEKFDSFINIIEEGSNRVLERSVTGQDVTEEYVDLESRLKSKRVVEERLLTFMEQAEKTEDLLKISNDLAKVQGEIEEILGRKNFLQNKIDLATINVHIQENNVTLTSMNDGELNTLEKTKEQFKKSINFLIVALSNLVIFFVGNIPIFLLLGIVGVLIWIIIKRKAKKE